MQTLSSIYMRWKESNSLTLGGVKIRVYGV